LVGGLPSSIIESHQNKKWVWPWSRGVPQNFGSPFNISATAKASDFKFGTQLGFAKAHHKITPREKWVWPWARGAPEIFGVPL